jgi:hypothetical protein
VCVFPAFYRISGIDGLVMSRMKYNNKKSMAVCVVKFIGGEQHFLVENFHSGIQ